MVPDSRASWHPDRAWVDPFIALLALLALLATGFTLRARQRGSLRPAEHAGLQGRMMEIALAGPAILGRETPARDWAKAEAQLSEPWDRALLAVLKAEQDLGHGASLREPDSMAVPVGVAGEHFRQAFLAAYAGGLRPDRAAREDLRQRLGNGYAADLLEARLRDREGGGESLRLQAKSRMRVRLAGAGLLGLTILSLAAGGLAVGSYLLATRARPPFLALPQWGLSGRAVAVVLLTWFLAYFVSGNLAGLLLHPWPGLRWLVPCLTYLLHATFGLTLLCRAEGIGFSSLWQRVAPGRLGPDLAWGAAFLSLAVLLVIVVALASNLFLKPDQSPQRDLQDLVRSLSGWGPNLCLFLTVAGLAPFFEEVLFRGFLLPVLARRQPVALATGISVLLFGAIHLQPAGLPTLCTLGLVMALAMRQTGSLRTPILVHACWNGGLFLVIRVFA